MYVHVCVRPCVGAHMFMCKQGSLSKRQRSVMSDNANWIRIWRRKWTGGSHWNNDLWREGWRGNLVKSYTQFLSWHTCTVSSKGTFLLTSHAYDFGPRSLSTSWSDRTGVCMRPLAWMRSCSICAPTCGWRHASHSKRVLMLVWAWINITNRGVYKCPLGVNARAGSRADIYFMLV